MENFFTRLFSKNRKQSTGKASKKRPIRKQPTLEQLEDRLAPAVLTWTGLDAVGGVYNWSDTKNWASDTLGHNKPGAGDTLVFDTGLINTAALQTVDDISSVSLDHIEFDAPAGKQYITPGGGLSATPAGNTLFANGGVSNTGYTINGSHSAVLTLTAATTPPTAGAPAITDGIAIDGKTLGGVVANGYAHANVTNADGITETFASTVSLKLSTATAVGFTIGDPNAVLNIASNINLNAPAAGDTLILTDTNTSAGTPGATDSIASVGMTLSGAISDGTTPTPNSGALDKEGIGAVQLSGNSTYSGGTTVNFGALIVSNSNGLGASLTAVAPLKAPITPDTVNQTGVAATGGMIVLENGVTINQDLNLNSDAFGGGLSAAGPTTNTWNGFIELDASGNSTLDAIGAGIGGPTDTASRLVIENTGMAGGSTNAIDNSTNGPTTLFINGVGTVEFAQANNFVAGSIVNINGVTIGVAPPGTPPGPAFGTLQIDDPQALGLTGIGAGANTVIVGATAVSSAIDFPGGTLLLNGNFTLGVQVNLSLAGAGVATAASPGGEGALDALTDTGAEVDGAITLNGVTAIGVQTGGTSLTLTGGIANLTPLTPGKLIKVGPGQLIVSTTASTYTGGTEIQDGILTGEVTDAFGGSPGNLTPIQVDDGTTLQMESPPAGPGITLDNSVTFLGFTFAPGATGALESVSGVNALAGDILLPGTAGQVTFSADRTIDVAPFQSLDILGTIRTPVAGAGAGILINPTPADATVAATTPPDGYVRFFNLTPNTYGGVTTVDNGCLILFTPSGVSGDLVIGDNKPDNPGGTLPPKTVGIDRSSAQVTLEGTNPIAPTSNVTVNADGNLLSIFGPQAQTIASLTLVGGQVTADTAASTLTVTGGITASAFKDAAGTVFPSVIGAVGLVPHTVNLVGGPGVVGVAFNLALSAPGGSAVKTIEVDPTRDSASTPPGPSISLATIDHVDLQINSVIENDSTGLGKPSGILKTGTGVLLLTAENLYTGTTTVAAGALAVTGFTEGPAGANPGASPLGIGDGMNDSAVTVNTGATLALVGATIGTPLPAPISPTPPPPNAPYDHTLNLNGPGFKDPLLGVTGALATTAAALQGWGGGTWFGNITVTDATTIVGSAPGTLGAASTIGEDLGGKLDLRGVISGSGGVNILGDSTVAVGATGAPFLGGAGGIVSFSSITGNILPDANAYLGITWVEAGAQLDLHKHIFDPANSGMLTPETAVPGTLVIFGTQTSAVFNPGVVDVKYGLLTAVPGVEAAGNEIGTPGNPLPTVNISGGDLVADNDGSQPFGAQVALGPVNMTNHGIIDIGGTAAVSAAVVELTAGLTAMGAPTPIFGGPFGGSADAIVSTFGGGDGILLLGPGTPAPGSQTIAVNPSRTGSSEADLVITATVSGGTAASGGITAVSPVSNGVGLTKVGLGVLVLANSLSFANSQGFTDVNAGQLWLDGPGFNQIPLGTTLTVGTGALIPGSVVVNDLATSNVGDASVVVNSDGLFTLDDTTTFNPAGPGAPLTDNIGTSSASAALTLNGGQVTINSEGGAATLFLDGPVSVTATALIQGINGNGFLSALDFDGANTLFTVAPAAVTLTVDALLQDGGLTKAGAGKMVLEGTTGFGNTYSGATVIMAGNLAVDDVQPQSQVVMDPPLGTTAELSGIGTVGTISTPGAGVSIQAPGNSPGAITVSGDDTFASNSQYEVVLGGVGGVTAYSQLLISGAATLNSAFLNVTVPGSFASGTNFDIIHADNGVTDSGVAPVGELTGLVNGVPTLLSNGQIFTSADGKVLEIQYSADDVVLTVLSPSTSTSVVGVPNPVVFGHSVTFTATVTNTTTGATPTGTVQFFDNGVLLGNGSALAGSGASATSTFTTTALPSGPQSITAVYTATGTFLNSTSPIYIENVNAVTSTTVASSLNPSNFGQSVVFTATVTNDSSTTTAPTGSVEFFDGTTDLGAGSALVVGGNTVASTFTTSTLPAGVDDIIAVYTPTGDFVGSQGSVNQTVNAANTVAVSGNPNPVVFGHSVTLTATITNTSGTATPAGTVEFFDGLVDLGSGSALSGSGATATSSFSTTGLPSGPQVIKAVYTAAPGFQSGSGQFTENVDAVTTTGVASSLNPSNFDQSVTFTATVVNTSGTAAPTGTVEFFDGLVDLGPGSALVVGGNTVASTFTTSTLPAGVDDIIAVYTPTGDFVGSQGSVNQTVNAANTVAVSGNPNPVVFGHSVTLTATITNTSGTATPAGTVEFFDGLVDLGPGTAVSGNDTSSTSTFTTTSLPSGPQVIKAVYTAAPGFQSGSGQFTENVLAVTSTSVVSSQNPSTAGQSVTFTATVTNTSGTASPTGSVEFFNGTTDLGAGSALTVGGPSVTSTFTTSTLPSGVDDIIAVYTPNGDFVGSQGSVSQNQTVNALTSTSVAGNPQPVVFGHAVTFTATVTNTSGTTTPTGSVEFFDGTVDLGGGTALSGTTASATSTFTTTGLPAGPQTIRAVYTASGAFVGSNGSTIEDVLAVTSTTVASSLNPSTAGQSVTFTATVTNTSSGASPTGTVEFFNGTTDLGPGTALTSGGPSVTSTFTTSTLPSGVDDIIAVYTATGDFVGSQGSVTQNQTVNAITTTSVAGAPNPSVFGNPVTLTATVTATSGTATPTGSVEFFDGNVDLGPGSSLSGTTASATSTFTTTGLPAGADAIKAVYTPSGAFVGSSGTTTQNVEAGTGTTVATSGSPSIQGNPVTFTATVVNNNSSATPTGTVEFDVNGTPTFGPVTVSGAGSSATATWTTSSLPVGSDTIVAVYTPTGNFATSSGSVQQTVIANVFPLPPKTIVSAFLKTTGELDLFNQSTGAITEISPANTIKSYSTALNSTGQTVVFAIVSGADAQGNLNTLWEFNPATFTVLGSGWTEISIGNFQQISAADSPTSVPIVYGVITAGSSSYGNSVFEYNGSFFTQVSGNGITAGQPGLVSSVSAVSTSAGPALYAITQTGSNVWLLNTAGNWAEESSGAFTSISAGVNGVGAPVVYGVLTNGQLWEQNGAFNNNGGIGLNIGWQQLSSGPLVSGNGTAPATFVSLSAGGADTVFAIASGPDAQGRLNTLWQHKNAGWTEISVGSFAQISATESTTGADLVFAALSDGEFWDYNSALLPANNPWTQILPVGTNGVGVASASVPD